MAQERNLGTARAADTTSTDDRTKAELQRQMDEARDSISNTVNEIKDTVTNQYQYVKSSVSEALDWREQFKKRPIAWSAGALSVGFLLGYVVAGAVKGDEESGFDYAAGESLTTDSSTGIRYPPYSVRQTGSASRGQAYSSGTARTAYSSQSTAAERPSYSSGYQPEEQESTEPEGPGLLERFKETQAYDKLQAEVASLGNRVIEQLSTVGKEVVLPALFAKLTSLIGVDLSGSSPNRPSSAQTSRQSGSGGSSGGQSFSAAGTGSSGGTGTSGSVGSNPSGTSYATSENQAYGIEAKDSQSYSQGAGGTGTNPGSTSGTGGRNI